MKIKIKEFEINIEITFIVVTILTLISSYIRRYFENYYICFLFITFHELSHMLTASIYGIKTKSLNIRVSGLNINLDSSDLKGKRWLVIFFAGPFSNVVLALLFHNIKFIHEINIALAMINLIPIYPLDGYQILKQIMNLLSIKGIENKMKRIQIIMLVLLTIFGVMLIVERLNPSLFMIVVFILFTKLGNDKKYNSNMYQKYYKNITKFRENY